MENLLETCRLWFEIFCAAYLPWDAENSLRIIIGGLLIVIGLVVLCRALRRKSFACYRGELRWCSRRGAFILRPAVSNLCFTVKKVCDFYENQVVPECGMWVTLFQTGRSSYVYHGSAGCEFFEGEMQSRDQKRGLLAVLMIFAGTVLVCIPGI